MSRHPHTILRSALVALMLVGLAQAPTTQAVTTYLEEIKKVTP